MIEELLTIQKDMVNAVRNQLVAQLAPVLAKSDGVYLTPSQRLIPSFAQPPFVQIKDPDIDFTDLRQKGQMNPVFTMSIFTYQRIYKDDYALMGSPTGTIGVLDLSGKVILALYPIRIFNCYSVFINRIVSSVPMKDPTSSDNAFYQSQELIFEWRKHVNTVQAVA
ncbi:hypothetical protein L0152_07240 [bacterium]|nr:hypothetical protein [bacterium]